jgi:hypothetical protein
MADDISEDPTALTIKLIQRELESFMQILETRLNAMDKATELLNTNMTRVPTETDKAISHLKELHNEKFDSVQKQFAERDIRMAQAAVATKIAVDAALQAQKEAAGSQNESNSAAITKSEAAATKQIDGIQALIQGNDKATSGKIDDLKTQIGSLDTRVSANSSHSKGAADGIGWIIAAVTVLLAIALFVFEALHPNTTSPQIIYLPAVPGVPTSHTP